MRNLIIKLGIAIFALSLPLSALHAEDKVVAKVNGIEITEKDMHYAETEMFNQLLNVNKKARRKVLIEYLIETQLLASAGTKAKISETDTYKKRQDYYQRRAIRDSFFHNQVFEAVKDADIQKTYDDAKKQEEASVRHILVKEEDKAKEIHEKLKKGEDFSKLAKENSMDPGSKDKGGALGYILRDQVVPTFADAAFALEKKGDLSAPVKSQFGWHVIMLEDKRKRALPPFDAVKGRIQEVLWQQKAQEMIEGLRKEAKIEFMDKELEKPLETPRGSN